MTYATRRIRSNNRNRRRINSLRLTQFEILQAVGLLLLALLAIGAGGWLGLHYPD
jgi:hypothetical protein